MGHDAVSVVEIGLSGADDKDVRAAAVADQRALLMRDADFANVLGYPPAETPGVVRLRLHPATEEAIDEMLIGAIPRVAEVSVRGKLVVVDERKIRIRG
jgi:predicted nuclease of predicted toxin-antitoxin system